MSLAAESMNYPITLAGKIEYWNKKPSFQLRQSCFNFWMMLAIESGQFTYEIDSASGTAGAGDVLLVPPGMTFKREIIEPLTFFYAAFTYQDETYAEEKHLGKILNESFGCKFTLPEQDRLLNNFRHLLNICHDNDPMHRRWAAHFINDIWILVNMEIKFVLESKHAVRDPIIASVKEWIDKHAFNELKMKELSKKFDVHPVALTRRFQNAFGISPSRYLLSVRMEKAKSLLTKTNYTMDHIAQLCGYDNGYYFSKVFTKYANMNPSAYRKTYKLPDL